MKICRMYTYFHAVGSRTVAQMTIIFALVIVYFSENICAMGRTNVSIQSKILYYIFHKEKGPVG